VARGQDGQGRLPGYAPTSVVDIGSNSVRLVAYDASRRAPTPVYNEKILCGLGRSLAKTGAMARDNIDHALCTLVRFKAMNAQLGAKKVYAVATAAARDASNGPEFVARAETALGSPIKVLSGKQEAKHAAFGVLAGIPDADGLVGDLGGGSLELIQVKGGKTPVGITLPLGPLRLLDAENGKAGSALEQIERKLKGLQVFDNLEGRDFYAVGGTWRNLARLHMAQDNYPLAVLHQYSLGRAKAADFAALIAEQSTESLKNLPMISENRAETLPLGAAILTRLLRQVPVNNMVISAYGLREGVLYSKLKPKTRKADPLLSAARDLARLRGRSLKHADELCEWTDRLFAGGDVDETPHERRLRHAACLMADIGWRANQDYQGEQALNIIAHAVMGGVSHADRAFLALSVHYRYEGSYRAEFSKRLLELLDEQSITRARIIAAAQRLAYVLTGALPGLLPDTSLARDHDRITLNIPKKHKAIWGERVARRLALLGGVMGLTSAAKVAGKIV
jgi:exopolyphosphatase/guanosine-5'-triphosphate,3'-diphosphate pyrophosphatase